MSPFTNWIFLLNYAVWLFDLDETLMWNETTYNQAVVDFIAYLTRVFRNRIAFAGSIGRLIEENSHQMIEEINPGTGKLYKYSADRFPDALVRTYKRLCENGYGEYDDAVAEHCRKIGKSAFFQKNYEKLGLVPGAEETLTYLADKGHRLVLVTKGDERVQRKKIDALNLARWFTEEYIVEEKTWRVYNDIMISLRNIPWKGKKDDGLSANAVVVGNSFSGDIRSALALGLNAVFIPCPTSMETESVEIGDLPADSNSRLVTLKEIKEIIPWVKALSKQPKQ